VEGVAARGALPRLRGRDERSDKFGTPFLSVCSARRRVRTWTNNRLAKSPNLGPRDLDPTIEYNMARILG
jgi:hypothetical protein